jgi:lipopolysaccharide export system permease protein
MIIWFSSGRGLADFAAPMVRFAWPILVLIAMFAFVGWPWANSQTQGMRDQYERRSDIDRIAPGEFQESAGRNRVFFIDKDTADGTTASNVFISSIERNRQLVTSARSGKVETVDKTRFLMLNNGQRLERPLDNTGLKISEFETYGAKVGSDEASTPDSLPARAQTTRALLANPTLVNRAELSWRLGMLLAAANFVLLALAVASVNPRVGRSGNLVFALFAFVIYYNMLNLGQGWVGSGSIGSAPFLLALHGGVFLIAVAWLAKRHNNWGFGGRRAASAQPSGTA